MEKTVGKNPGEIDNKEVVKALKALQENGTSENLNKLCFELLSATVLVPTHTDKIDGMEVTFPFLLTSEDKLFYQPVYTDLEHLKKGPSTKNVSVTSFPNIIELIIKQNEAVAKEKAIAGIVINPNGENITLVTDILKNIYHTIHKKYSADDAKMIVRCKFEQLTLPGIVHETGEDFFKIMEESGKEYLNNLYKNAYSDKLEYSYKPDDFNICLKSIDDNILIARIQMPGAQNITGMCPVAYAVWIRDKKVSRYFAVVNESSDDEIIGAALVEITLEKRAIKVGRINNPEKDIFAELTEALLEEAKRK